MEDVDVVLRVGRHRGDAAELHAGGERRPIGDLAEFERRPFFTRQRRRAGDHSRGNGRAKSEDDRHGFDVEHGEPAGWNDFLNGRTERIGDPKPDEASHE